MGLNIAHFYVKSHAEETHPKLEFKSDLLDIVNILSLADVAYLNNFQDLLA